MKEVTLLFLIDKKAEKILLAMKKRGFGEGKYNGVGGKVEDREEILAAAVREAKEEIGVSIQEEALQKIGTLRFSFEEKPEWAFHCHAFFAEVWEGEPAESEEMAPQWFGFSEIPFERMWVDDKFWLPRTLGGEVLDAEFHFTKDGSEILRHSIRTL